METADVRSSRYLRGCPAGPIPRSAQQDSGESRQPRVGHGCKELIDLLAPAPGSRVVELGAGSGTLLDHWGARLSSLGALELVDISPMPMAPPRHRASAFRHIRVVKADASTYRAPWPVDCVYFSYALTRTPDWVRALNNALGMLKPGGRLGIVDFYVAGADQQFSRVQHAALTRMFWTYWLRREQVRLCEWHLAALSTLTDKEHLLEGHAPLPNLPLLKVPYYVFVGTKPSRPRPELITEFWKKSATQP